MSLDYTRISAARPDRLTKRFQFNAAGDVEPLRGGNLVRGRAELMRPADLRELGQQLDGLAINQAVCLGIASLPDAVVVAQGAPDSDAPGTITRTRPHFAWSDGPGVMLLDHDEFPDRLSTPEALRAVLILACPALAAAPMLIRPSASAGIRRTDGQEVRPLGKWHVYIPVSRARDIPDAGRRLGVHLMAAGWAWSFIDKAGRVDVRTAVDLSVWLPERLDFAAGPDLAPGLYRPEAKSILFGDPAGLFDLTAIPEPDDAASAAAAQAKAAARAEAQPRAAEIRTAYVLGRAERTAARTGRPVETVRREYAALMDADELPAGHELQLQDGRVVSVGEVLADWSSYEGKRGYDPIDPERSGGDDRIAHFGMRNGQPSIHSYAGGGYWLALDTNAWAAVVFKDSPCSGSLVVAPAVPTTVQPEVADVVAIPSVPTDDALALAFVAHFEPRYRYTPGMGWMFNLGTRWERDERKRYFDDVRTLCRQVASACPPGDAKRIASAKTVAAVTTMAAADQRIVLDAGTWDADRRVLNTPAGLFDLRTGQPVDRAGHYLTQCTAVCPDFAARAPVFMRFVREVFTGDESLISFMQRAMGYSMTGETREQVLFFWHGAGGNGKSTLLDLLQWLAGTYALKLPGDTLMASRNERHPTGVAQLQGKRLAVSSELDEGQFFNEPLLKELTGDAEMRARFMRGDFFTFHQTQKHVVVGNYRPRLRGGDPALARRLLLVPFEAVFDKSTRDRGMLDKLKAEGPAVLAWLIRGAVDWYRDGLMVPARVMGASADYLQAHDDLQLWRDECCTGTGSTKASLLYASFKGWKERRGEHAPSQTTWGERMRHCPGIEKRTSNGVVYSPIGLRAMSWPG